MKFCRVLVLSTSVLLITVALQASSPDDIDLSSYNSPQPPAEQTRSLAAAFTTADKVPQPILIQKVAFTTHGGPSGNQPVLYTGLAEGAGDGALTAITVGANKHGRAVNQTKLAGSEDDEGESQLNDKAITNLALLSNKLPVVTIDDNKVYVVTNVTTGGKAVESAVLKDAAAADLGDDSEIPALAATGGSVVYDTATKKAAPFVFAAVSQADKAWVSIPAPAADALNRGIAALVYDATKKPATLTLVDPTDMVANEKPAAANLIMTIDDEPPVAFIDPGAADRISGAKIGTSVAMHWDDKLERLYIGLSDVGRDDDTKEGGVAGVVMGYINPADKTFNLKPIIYGMQRRHFTNDTDGASDDAKNKNANKSIIGFYRHVPGAGGAPAATIPATCTIKSLRTMHTSTGKDYLIVASKIGNENVVGGNPVVRDYGEGFFALPLTPTGATPDQKGVIGQKVVANPAAPFGLLTVGDGQLPIAHDDNKPWFSISIDNPLLVNDFFVDGDTVYACYGGKRAISSGIFAYSALFDEYGNIIAWTPSQRVMGYTGKVLGGGVDAYGNFYAATSGAPAPDADKDALFNKINRVQISQWGASDEITKADNPNTNQLADNLSSQLAEIFPAEQGGVHNIFNFDEGTPGFLEDRYSLMVATGVNKIAIIETGRGADVPSFAPNYHFTRYDVVHGGAIPAGANVFVFDVSTLNLGPITSVEVARSNGGNQGWIFVGGYNGAAVLGANADGAGWGPGAGAALDRAQLIALVDGLRNVPQTHSWKMLTPSNGGDFTKVRKLACLNGWLYVTTDQNVYAVRMAANKFSAAPNLLGEQRLQLNLQDGEKITDFIPLNGVPAGAGDNASRALVASTKRLLYVEITGAAGALTQHEIAASAPIIQMSYVSTTKGLPSLQGNLFVLSGDISQSPAPGKIERFVVNMANPANLANLAAFNANQIKLVSSQAAPDALKAAGAFDINDIRAGMFTDGGVIVHSRGKHLGNTDFAVRMAPRFDADKGGPIAHDVSLTALLGIDERTMLHVARPVRNTAMGTMMIPGEWGVRVNE